MEVQWKEHTLKVTGNWTARWLFLAPEYQLWLDDELLDSSGGPRLHPTLEAIYEDEAGKRHHITAELVSIVGFKPSCDVSIEGDLLSSQKVRVDNFLNPFLMLAIIISTAVMLYVGPDVISEFLPM
jgi:hypothetical protein